MRASRRTFLQAAAGLTVAPAAGLALPAAPKLLVVLIAEQFRPDYFDSHAGAFGAGGFRRLLSEGSYFPDCRVESSTFTASGLATIASGCYPNVHGIVADRWFDRASRGAVSASGGQMPAASLFGSLRTFAVSFDAAHVAILGAREAAGDFLSQHGPDRARSYPWQALGMANAPPMRTIEFDAARPGAFLESWKASPAGQAAQFAFVRETLTGENLGHGDEVDCLAAVLGSLGALGYQGGGKTPLVYDLVSQLDRQVESLLSFLDSSVGENGFQVAFTACHGALDAPGAAVAGTEIAAAVGAGVDAYLYPFLYLKSGARREDRVAAAEAAQRTGKVSAWFTADGDCSHTGEFRRRLENSFYRGRSGDVMFAYAPGAVERYGDGRGISYGSIYNYDGRVPLIFYGPQFQARTFEQPVELVDIAPTLARAVGVAAPSSSTGRVLGEAFL